MKPLGPVARSVIDYPHAFVGNAHANSECRICHQHRWYRLHHHKGRVVSREEFFTCRAPLTSFVR